MKIVSGSERVKIERTAVTLACIAAVCAMAASPMLAQDGADQRSGVSHPSSAPIVIDSGNGSTPVPAAPATSSSTLPPTAVTSAQETVYGPYVPYHPAAQAEPTAATVANGATEVFNPDGSIAGDKTAGQALTAAGASAGTEDEDAGIVTHVPSIPGEIPEGSLLKVRLGEALSTLTTVPGTKFTAELSEPVMQDGQVVVPAGSIMEGRVTWVRGGRRIGGGAAIHLEPTSVLLPDGTQYALQARAIDTNSWDNTKVDSEGTIIRSENTKRNLGVMSLTTGGGLAAGAIIGGLPGAVIGAGVGAGISTVIWLEQNRQAVLPKDLGLIFSLTEPMSVTPASASFAPSTIGSAGGE